MGIHFRVVVRPETNYSSFNLNYTAVSGGDSDNVTSTFTK